MRGRRGSGIVSGASSGRRAAAGRRARACRRRPRWSRRRRNAPGHAVTAASSSSRDQQLDVAPQDAVRRLEHVGHPDDRGQMEDQGIVGREDPRALRRPEVLLDQADVRPLCQRVRSRVQPPAGEVVDQVDLLVTIGERPRQMRADESPPAGDQHPAHALIVPPADAPDAAAPCSASARSCLRCRAPGSRPRPAASPSPSQSSRSSSAYCECGTANTTASKPSGAGSSPRTRRSAPRPCRSPAGPGRRPRRPASSPRRRRSRRVIRGCRRHPPGRRRRAAGCACPPRPPSSSSTLSSVTSGITSFTSSARSEKGNSSSLEAEQLASPVLGEQRVLGQAVAADAEARLAHVRVGRAHPDRVDRLEEVEARLLCEAAPLLHEGDGERPVAVLEHLRGLGGRGGAEPGERVLVHVDNR